jgi:hypothetical protein
MATFETCYLGYGELYLYAMTYSYAVTDADLHHVELVVDRMKLVADEENDV